MVRAAVAVFTYGWISGLAKNMAVLWVSVRVWNKKKNSVKLSEVENNTVSKRNIQVQEDQDSMIHIKAKILLVVISTTPAESRNVCVGVCVCVFLSMWGKSPCVCVCLCKVSAWMPCLDVSGVQQVTGTHSTHSLHPSRHWISHGGAEANINWKDWPFTHEVNCS